MAPDNKWPTEDEDFDAVSDGKSKGKSVHIIDEGEEDQQQEVQGSQEPHEQQVEEPEPESVPDEPASPEEPEETKEPEEANPETSEAEIKPEDSPQETFKEPIVTDSSNKQGSKANIGRLLLEIILVASVVGLGLWGYGLSNDNKALKNEVTKLNNNPQLLVQKQTNELIAKVGSLIDLPKDETPTVANVSDAVAAKKQSAFFNNAQNGDKVLMYAKAGEAILYRPSTNKIVLVAPLTFTNNTTSTKPTTTTPSTTRR